MSEKQEYASIDQLPTDGHGLLEIPKDCVFWDEANEENRRRIGVLLATKANTGPPEEYELEFANGFVQMREDLTSMYSKNDSGIVIVNFMLAREDGGAFPRGIHTFANVPMGFTPARITSGSTTVHLDGSGMSSDKSIAYYVTPGGIMTYHNPLDNVTGLGGIIVFYAAQ